MKRILAVVMALTFVCSLVACKNEPTSATPGSSEKGRYAETNMTLPSELTDGEIFQMSKEEGNPVFYLKREEQGMMHIHKYTYRDGVATDVTPEWLGTITLSPEFYTQQTVLEGNPSYFFYASEDSDMNYRAYLLCSNDGKVPTDVTPKEWTIPEPEGGYYLFPSQMTLLSSGNLVAAYYGRVDILNKDGEVIKAGKQSMENAEGFLATKDGYAALCMNDMYELEGVSLYLDGETEPTQTVDYRQELDGSPMLDITESGELVLTCGDGIFRLNENDAFEKVADGKMTSLSDLDMYPRDMLAMDDGTYYILYGNMLDETFLMHYVYDPELPVTPEHELKIYTLRQSFSLQQAAVNFQKQHPDTLVTIEVALKDDASPSEEADAIQRLLTEMISGNDRDLMIMDGLPVQSFVEKGLLTDLSGIVNPLEEEGKLYNNVCELYRQEDGSLPVVPTRFGTTMLIGKTLDVTKITDVHSFAQTMESLDEPILGPMTSDDIVDQFLPFVTADLIKDKQLDEELLKQTLIDMKTISEKAELVKKYSNNQYAYGIWDIAYKGSLAFDETAGFAESMFPLAGCKLVQGSFTFFGNAYSPSLQIGICKTTSQQERAEEFVSSLLDVSTQSGEYYEGFPVNRAAMENLRNMDRTNYAAYTDIQVGEDQYDPFEILDFSEEDGQKMVDMCDKLDICRKEDAKITEEVKAVLPAYLDGSMTVEDAVSTVKSNVALYLAE